MKNLRLFAAALLVLLLAGCSIHYHHDRCPSCTGGSGVKGDPANPVVLVTGGAISIDQDVLRFTKDQTNITITWRLPYDSKLSFPDNGVVFERAAAEEIVNCRRGERPTEFTCLNRHSRPGNYKYGINVNEDGKPLKPLDPFVWNE